MRACYVLTTTVFHDCTVRQSESADYSEREEGVQVSFLFGARITGGHPVDTAIYRVEQEQRRGRGHTGG